MQNKRRRYKTVLYKIKECDNYHYCRKDHLCITKELNRYCFLCLQKKNILISVPLLAFRPYTVNS